MKKETILIIGQFLNRVSFQNREEVKAFDQVVKELEEEYKSLESIENIEKETKKK